MTRDHRDTIVVEDAVLTEVQRHPGDQYILRLQAPEIARRAAPGTFVHLTCDAALPMRRPLSLQRVSTQHGWIEVLYKIVGTGLAALSAQPPGTPISVLGPIGKPFEPHTDRPRTLLIGGGVGIPPMIYLAEHLAGDNAADWQPLVFMGSEIPFPFATVPAALALDPSPPDATHALALTESLGIPSRLASRAGLAGAHAGWVSDLADQWLAAQDEATLATVELFACGPTPMLAATAAVAARHSVPCQVSLEEYMACAVGGCAGCVVPVHTDGEVQMRRVCVDGPVFAAASVFPDAGA